MFVQVTLVLAIGKRVLAQTVNSDRRIAEPSMVDYYNRLEESSKYFACILRAIADNKSSPSFSNGRREHLKPIALPFMLPS